MNTTCRRVLDKRPLQIEVLGPVLSAMWFSDLNPAEQDFQTIQKIAEHEETPHWFFRRMIERGTNPNQQQSWKSDACPEKWVGIENDIQYEFQLDEGLSPGLFLDQGKQRRWVYELCKQNEAQSVLNLFAYTGGFSLAAALGGAKEVVTVDLSKKYIEWSKRNFVLNGLDVSKYEFWSVDSLRFLEGSQRRGRKFDLIICDPPSFSRSGDTHFRLETAYPKLLDFAFGCLSEKGTLQFSCNLQKWNFQDFQKVMKAVAQEYGKKVHFPKLANEFQGAPDASKIAIF